MSGDVTVALSFRVTDRKALVNAVFAVWAAYPEVQPSTITSLSDEGLIEALIEGHLLPYSRLGLESADL